MFSSGPDRAAHARRNKHANHKVCRRQADGCRTLRIEWLEDRHLLSLTIPGYATPDYLAAVGPNGVSPLSTAGPTGYTPAQIRQAYGINQISFNYGTVTGDGSGTTIAIIDAYNDPNIANDLHQFDLQFGLPDPALTKVNQTGGTTLPAANAGWITEIALDVEWAHAIAPGANILLVEANSASFSDLFTAVNYARHATGVVAVSMSWGGGEFSSESTFDSYFTTPSGHGGVTFVASSGRQWSTGRLPGNLAQRAVRRRYDTEPEQSGRLRQRVGLERQRRGDQRLRIAAELSKGSGHAEHGLPHQSRRVLRCQPEHRIPGLRLVQQSGVVALGPVGRDQRRGPAVGGPNRHCRPGTGFGRPRCAGRRDADLAHALWAALRRFPRHHQRHEHREPQLFGGARV